MTKLMRPAAPQLQDFLTASAKRLPDKVALVCRGKRVTYAELARDADALAQTLRERGVARGDRVVIFGDNSVEAVTAFWAILKANAVVSVVNPLTKRGKLDYLLEDCRPAAMVTDAHLWRVFHEPASESEHMVAVVVSGEISDDRIQALPGGIRWEEAVKPGMSPVPESSDNIDIDLATVIYTSGSTGKAKGVMLSHHNMLTAAHSVGGLLEMQEDDVVLSVLPLAFNYGLYQMILAFRVGARLILEKSFAYPAQVLKTMADEHVTGFPGVPTIFAIFAEMRMTDYDLSAVRFITNTAAALPLKHIRALQKLFPVAKIYSMYGLTECKRCTYLPPEDLDRKPGSVGFAIPNTELWLVDEEDRRLGPGEAGQVVIRGGTVMQGYWDKPEETAKVLRPGILPGERVLYTGDLCRLDEDGYLFFISRMDDIIKSRGEKVAPKEVENVLINMEGVKEVAVIGVPDAILGEAVKAYVVLEEEADLDAKQIQRFCQSHLESFMVPKHVVLAASLPKTAMGKITKVGLT